MKCSTSSWSGLVEPRGEQALGERHADGVGEALAERAGGGLHAGRAAALRVAGRLGAELAEALQLLDRQRVAGEVQQAIEQHRAVAVREHEAVAVRPIRVGRVVAQVALPERHRDLGHPHRHAGVAGLGGFHRVHGERANGIRELGLGCFGRDGGVHRKRQIILSAKVTKMSELPFRAPLQFEAACFAEKIGEGHWFVFCGDKLLVELGPPERPSDDPRFRARPAFARLPLHKNHNVWGSEAGRTLYLGRLGGVDCWTAELPANAAPPAGLAWEGLRPLFSVLDDDHFALAGRALQLLQWDRDHQFCGRCGTPTTAKRDERVRVCPACKLSAYPRVAPAVMALVHREKRASSGAQPALSGGHVQRARRLRRARRVARAVRRARSRGGSRRAACAAAATSPASRGRSRIR